MPTYRDEAARVTLLDLARRLRQSSTPAEVLLWRILRNRQIAGAKFRRQHQFGPYILDFYCHEARLAVEIDGDSHVLAGSTKWDLLGTQYLESTGIRVIRYTNREVLQSRQGVAIAVWAAVEEPSPSPSQRERDQN